MGNLLSGNWDRSVGSPESSLDYIAGHKPSNCSIFNVNGMLNNKTEIKNRTRDASKNFGYMEIDYFYSATRGFIGDILSSIWGKLGFQTADSRRIATSIRNEIQMIKN